MSTYIENIRVLKAPENGQKMIALVSNHLSALLAALVQLRGDGISILWV